MKPSPLLDALEANFAAVYRDVCESGYVTLGRTRLEDSRARENPWQTGTAFPPSYGGFGRYRFLQTLKEARRLAGKRVLEVAAGGAFQAACISEPGREVVVNDLQPQQDELQQWTTGDRLRWAAGNLFELSPNELGVFDLVIACEVLEHIAHGDAFIAKLKGFVRPGGTLLVTTPNGEFFRSRLPTYSQVEDFAALESRQFQPDAEGHLFLYTSDELRKLLEDAGFTDLRLELLATPLISGNAGFRFLPQRSELVGTYLKLDALLRRSERVRRRLCTQLFATARRPD